MSWQCWQCGAPLEDLILPVSRREACRSCGAEIHACRMCRHYRPDRSQACAEERAEDVSNRELANFCDWYDPIPDAWDRAQPRADDAARAQLDALFGGGSSTPARDDPDLDALNDLFSSSDD